MNATKGSDADIVIRKLASTFPISDEERAAVAALPMQIADIRADQDVVREGDRPTRCFALLDGFTCNFKLTGSGKRQIMAFNIPGDMPDLQSLHLPVLDNSIGTMTPCRLGFIQHEVLRDLCERYPRIAAAFWRQTLIEAAVFREWMTNIGRRQAYGRIAHVMCEMVVRMRAVGLADENGCTLAMTQSELGDATGISTVHVNRTLQELRGNKLITLTGDRLTVLDWEGLQKAGDFDPTYLHIQPTQAAA